MLMKPTLELIEKLLSDCEITSLQIYEDNYPIHGGKNTEYKILIDEIVHHHQIVKILEVLRDYDNIRMQVIDNGLELEEYPEEEA